MVEHLRPHRFGEGDRLCVAMRASYLPELVITVKRLGRKGTMPVYWYDDAECGREMYVEDRKCAAA